MSSVKSAMVRFLEQSFRQKTTRSGQSILPTVDLCHSAGRAVTMMLANLFIVACGFLGVWHFGCATYNAFKHKYVMWGYSRASAGSRVYQNVDPRRYWVGTWTNIVGLGLALAATSFLVHEAIDQRVVGLLGR